jgi:hypothetical protein
VSAAVVLRLPGCDAPIRVTMTDEQRQAVDAAAQAAGEGVSAWVRQALDAAAGRREYAEAAAAAGLDLTAWIRVLVLERAGATDLRRQLARAARPTRPRE